MPNAHLYLFSDACPSDWLVDGHDEDWHTIVNLVFQSDPNLQPLVEQGRTHEEVLAQDALYARLISRLLEGLPSAHLRKWGTGPGYRAAFCQAFAAVQPESKPLVSAWSFQEQTLRASKAALLRSYNLHIGGIEGRGIGFEEFADERGRVQMKHSFVNFHGYNEIQAPVNQMLVLLFMSWFVADQFVFFFNDIVRSGRYGYDGLALTVVSDKLSGDDDFRRKSEQNLSNLIDPDMDGVHVVLRRSQGSDSFSGDLLVDNLAGWLTAAVGNPDGEHADFARALAPTGIWRGWYELLPSTSRLEGVPVISRLTA